MREKRNSSSAARTGLADQGSSSSSSPSSIAGSGGAKNFVCSRWLRYSRISPGANRRRIAVTNAGNSAAQSGCSARPQERRPEIDEPAQAPLRYCHIERRLMRNDVRFHICSVLRNRALRRGPILLPQLSFQDLAGSSLGQAFEKLDRPRTFEMRQPGAAELQDVLFPGL
jgi:hypothetical protein